MQDIGDVGPLDLQPDRPDELQHLDDDRVRQLRFADDVGEQRLRVRRIGHLASQQPGHHLDARQRILQFVRDAGGHLAERRQPIAQALPLLCCSTCVRSLKNITAPIDPSCVVRHLRKRVADDAVDILQPQLGAVGQRRQLERADRARATSGRSRNTSLNGRPSRPAAGPGAKIRYASSFISARVPSRRMAMTPLRMLLTMCRKKRSSVAGFLRSGALPDGRTSGTGRRIGSSDRLDMGDTAISSTSPGANNVPVRSGFENEGNPNGNQALASKTHRDYNGIVIR